MARRLVWHQTGLIAMVVGVGVAQADEPVPVAPGLRVRLTAPSVSGKRLVGTVVALDDATLTLQRQGGQETLQVPRGAMTTTEVSWRRSRKGKGAAIGGLVGLGAAVAIGLAAGEDCSPFQDVGDPLGDAVAHFLRSFCYSKGEMAAVAAILTLPAGALLGLAVAPGEKWQPSSLDRLSVRITPARGGRPPERLAPLLNYR
jgi:hypothetical protein